MEIHQNPLIKQFKGLARVEAVVKDSTAIMLYKTCGLKYFYRIVLGYDTKDVKPYLVFGSAVHKYKEVIELEYKANLPLLEKDFGNNKIVLFEFCHTLATKAALDVWNKGMPQGTQVGTKWDFMTEKRLKLTCNKMKEWWIKEKTIGNIHVLETEQPFSIVIKDESNEWFIGGRFDQIIKWSGKLWGRDFKTSSKPDAFFSRNLYPNHQFTQYTYAQSQLHGEQVQGQLVEMIYNEKAKGPEIYNHPVSFTIEQIKDWLADTIEWLKRIDKSRETDHYPKQEGHCNFCEFHNVCKMANENGRMSFLKNNYKFEPWDFNNVRD